MNTCSKCGKVPEWWRMNPDGALVCEDCHQHIVSISKVTLPPILPNYVIDIYEK